MEILYCGFLTYVIASIFTAMSGNNLVLLVVFTIISGIGSTLACATAFTIMMCAMKLGIAGAGILSYVVLNKGGYIADQIQTESAISVIHWNMYWFRIIIYILGLGMI